MALGNGAQQVGMHCARPQVALQCQTQWRQFGIGPGGGRLQVDEALGRQHCRSRWPSYFMGKK